MASNINSNNINGAYPTPGVDNDSQGFRTNFTNIKNNFVQAKLEIEDLQNKAILKNALNGGALNNDMGGSPIISAEIKDFRETEVDHGTIQGTVTLDHMEGHFHKVVTYGDISLAFANMPPMGTVGRVKLYIGVSSITHTITLPETVTHGLGGILNWNAVAKSITFDSVGTYIFEFITNDEGTTFHIQDITRGSTLSAGATYSLPAATSNLLGGIKVGSGLAIDVQGVLRFDGPSIGAEPGGAISTVQFNNGSQGFAGSNDFTFNAGTRLMTVAGNIWAAGTSRYVFGGDGLNGLTIKLNNSSQVESTWQVDDDATVTYNRTTYNFSFNPNGNTGSATLTSNAFTLATSVIPNASQASWSVPSDVNLKTNIESIDPDQSLDTINSLNPVTFNMISNGEFRQGFIAQEIEEVYPESINSYLETDGNSYKTISFNADFYADLVGAIQALTRKVNNLESQLAEKSK